MDIDLKNEEENDLDFLEEQILNKKSNILDILEKFVEEDLEETSQDEEELRYLENFQKQKEKN